MPGRTARGFGGERPVGGRGSESWASDPTLLTLGFHTRNMGSWPGSRFLSMTALPEEQVLPEHLPVSDREPSAQGRSHYFPSPPKVESGG